MMTPSTRFTLIITALTLVLPSGACSKVGKKSQPAVANLKQDVALSPREILAKQPDFNAVESFSEFEAIGGVSVSMKVAKKGEYYRRETEIMVFFDKPGQPTIQYWRPAKIFVDDPPTRAPRWYDHASEAEIFVEAEGVKFEIVGTESVDGHECAKIKASKENRIASNKDDEVTVFIYSAKDLHNLAIKTEVFLPDRRRTYVLKDISFEVSDDLFKVLSRYKKTNV